MLTYKEKGSYGTLNVFYSNGIFMGELYMEVDGFYVYEPVLRGGFWEAYVLREIADKLDELNKPWQQNIDDYFSKKENK